MDTLGKSYSCKTCGMEFSSGRVLGGHVRKHMAAERLVARNKKFPVVVEKSEIVGYVVDEAHEHGGHFLRANPKKSAKSTGSNEREINSSSSENLCSRYKKGCYFGIQASVGRRRRRGKRDDDDVPSLHLGAEAAANSGKSPLEEILRDYERIHPTIRKKRSMRARCNGDLSDKKVFSDVDTPSSMLLSGGIQEDEIEAVISLLTISSVVRNWEVFEDNSAVDDIENVKVVSDGFNLGISNKKARICEDDDVGLELPQLPGYIGSLPTYPDVEEKSAEYEVSLYLMNEQVEVPSNREGDIVGELKSMVADVLECERLPRLISDDEVGGDCRKTKLSDPDCRKTELVFRRAGYKCKNCGNIFSTYEALECHRAEFRNGTSSCSALNSEKSKNMAVNGDVSSDSPDGEANKTFGYKRGLEKQNHNLAARGEVCTLGRHAWNGQVRTPYCKGSASRVSPRSCYGAVPHVGLHMEMLGEGRNVKTC